LIALALVPAVTGIFARRILERVRRNFMVRLCAGNLFTALLN